MMFHCSIFWTNLRTKFRSKSFHRSMMFGTWYSLLQPVVRLSHNLVLQSGKGNWTDAVEQEIASQSSRLSLQEILNHPHLQPSMYHLLDLSHKPLKSPAWKYAAAQHKNLMTLRAFHNPKLPPFAQILENNDCIATNLTCHFLSKILSDTFD